MSRLSPRNVLVAVVFAAFMVAAVGPDISRSFEKLAAPIVCRAPYDDHAQISGFRYQTGTNDDYLICVSASGKEKQPSVFGVRVVLFAGALIVLGLVGGILSLPSWRR